MFKFWVVVGNFLSVCNGKFFEYVVYYSKYLFGCNSNNIFCIGSSWIEDYDDEMDVVIIDINDRCMFVYSGGIGDY